jgi:patatin-like phospholipase/acyl hydrolase
MASVGLNNEALRSGPEQVRNGEESNGHKNGPVATRNSVGTLECTSSDVVDEIGKVCILSIDGGGMRGIIPGRVLSYLEQVLQEKSGDPDARIVDFFDVAAGTSVGGIITTMLFTDNGSGKPLFTGEDTWKLIAERGKQIFKIPASQQLWKKLRGILSPRYSTKYLEGILKEHLIRDGQPLTLRDTMKPVLIPCYDLESAGPFVFSRADALGAEAWNFPLWEVCRATSAVPSFFKPALLKSMDGNTSCTAIDGGIVMNNPTAAAITHVIHNKVEFPNVRGSQDLLVLSLGTGQFDQTYPFKKVRSWGAFQWARPVVKIVFDGISDMVDHTVSMSFGDKNRCNYVRIQVSKTRH